MISRRLPLAAALLCALQFPAAGADAADPSPFASAAPSPPPILESVERVVERLEAKRKSPCLEANQQGRPCFPASTGLPGPTASVRESLGLLGPGNAWSPDRPPTLDEMAPFRPGPPRAQIPNIASVSFDPGCAAKAALKKIKGKNNTYYLYRVRDPYGERVALYDRRLDPATFQGDLAFLGRFEGECAALEALRHEERK